MQDLTIIVPVFNGAPHLRRAVESIFRQSTLPKEIIAVDDASVDASLRLLHEIANESPIPMTVLPLSQNSGGPAVPVNLGLKNATSSIIAVLDQDDWLLPDAIERLTEAWRTHPDAAFIAGPRRNHGTLTPRESRKCRATRLLWRRLFQIHRHGPHAIVPGSLVAALLHTVGNFIDSFSAFSFRRDAGQLDESLRVCADLDFLFRLARQGDAVLLRKPTFVRSYHAGNRSRDQRTGLAEAKIVRERHPLDFSSLSAPDRRLLVECAARRFAHADWRRLIRALPLPTISR